MRARVTMTLVIIAVTSVISLTALLSEPRPARRSTTFSSSTSRPWRQGSTGASGRVTLLHGDLLHLGFNMYALYLAGTVVERWYGSIRFLLFYLACAAAGSVASFVFGGDVPSVGASGAIFGLFGILLTAARIHHPVDRQSRGIVSQLMFLIVINIVFGFASNGTIDNAAHLGGLAAGLWIGALVPPTGVPTMSSLWQRAGDPKTGGAGGAGSGAAAAGIAKAPGYILFLALAVIAVVVVAGLAFGTNARLG